jgi:hypothetical protein
LIFKTGSFWILEWESIILAKVGIGTHFSVGELVRGSLPFSLVSACYQQRTFPGNLGCHLGEVRSWNSRGVRMLGAI